MSEPPAIRHALLIHGAGAGGWEWNLWCEVFVARGIAAHAPDLQPSPAGLEATTLDDYREQVRAALAALPRPRAEVGASLGGLLAWLCGDLADALVLVNPLPPLPWAAEHPARDWPARVPWRREASLASTRRAMPDADEAAALYALRRWRDESGGALRQAQAGIAAPVPACRMLCIASHGDTDVDPQRSARFAAAVGASLIALPGSHVGPLLGREAARAAIHAADWLRAPASGGQSVGEVNVVLTPG
ncbi:alpha/beta fold hydrolase [Lysobacter yananisis]|uniref:Alpha/beta fold hydrolase n=1 Tax=Lysobacter yananisis TaxID=1003114 RepID=A0ABY9P886_9GAMM|nr:alpha/beta fold hydrolase [Lysobacter yananisis]WMT03290.1 alpha/beta fold hydrolase [Lysobacter yananisis]